MGIDPGSPSLRANSSWWNIQLFISLFHCSLSHLGKLHGLSYFEERVRFNIHRSSSPGQGTGPLLHSHTEGSSEPVLSLIARLLLECHLSEIPHAVQQGSPPACPSQSCCHTWFGPAEASLSSSACHLLLLFVCSALADVPSLSSPSFWLNHLEVHIQGSPPPGRHPACVSACLPPAWGSPPACRLPKSPHLPIWLPTCAVYPSAQMTVSSREWWASCFLPWFLPFSQGVCFCHCLPRLTLWGP